jgi:transcriptional repressor NrdR
LQKACNKRPISKEKIDTITYEIETEIFKNYSNEIDSRDIGKMVLKKLMKLDKIAYLRFASVYKNFTSINKFSKEIEKINKLNK